MPQATEKKAEAPKQNITKRIRTIPGESSDDRRGFGWASRHWFANPLRGGFVIRGDVLERVKDDNGVMRVVHKGYNDHPMRSDPDLDFTQLREAYTTSASKGISLLHAFAELHPNRVTPAWREELDAQTVLDFADEKYADGRKTRGN